MFPSLILLHFRRMFVCFTFLWNVSTFMICAFFSCILLLCIDPSVLRGPLLGHTDAVWGLAYSAAHQRLLSCSADGTLRLWNTTEVAPALSVFNDNQGTYFFPLFY